jgi:hypothetical protein
MLTFTRRWTTTLRTRQPEVHKTRIRRRSACTKAIVESLGQREVLLSEVILCKRLHLASSLKCYPTVALPFHVWRFQGIHSPEMGGWLCFPRLVPYRLDPSNFPFRYVLFRSARVRQQRVRLLLLLWLSATMRRDFAHTFKLLQLKQTRQNGCPELSAKKQ